MMNPIPTILFDAFIIAALVGIGWAVLAGKGYGGQ